MKERYCHICQQRVRNATHLKIHKDGIPIDVKKLDFYVYNFPKLKDKAKIMHMYEIEKQSLPMICKYADGIDLKSLVYVMEHYGIRIRSVKEALNLEETKLRLQETSLKKYGAINPLSRGTEPYKKKNKTVIDKYGVENVFQCIDDFVDEHFYKRRHSKISSLNMRIKELLTENHIPFEMEFRLTYVTEADGIKSKFYDFHILNTNVLLEVNGDYWHANPAKYSKDTVFQFPKNTVTAEEIWKMDEYKRNIAAVNNYKVVYLWEKEIKENNEQYILQKINDSIN